MSRYYPRCRICKSLKGRHSATFRVYKWQTANREDHCDSPWCPWCDTCAREDDDVQ